jgi:hypothetical protein
MHAISNIGKYLFKIKDEDLRNEKIKYFEEKLKIKFTQLSNDASKVGWRLNLNNDNNEDGDENKN